MVQIVVLDGATLNPGDNPWTPLQPLGELTIFDRTPPTQVVARARHAAVLVINKVRLSEAILAELPELKLIAVTATGFDCVDVAAATQRGIAVCNVPVYGTDSVAQHVLALLLHMLHRVDLHDQAVRAGEWAERGEFSFWKVPLIELQSKTLGVIGWGRIGRRVAQLGHALGMSILAHTRTPAQPPDYAPFAWSALEPLVEQSDVVSLHCPLTEQTRGLIHRDLLRHFKPSAYLINASRGPLVVEQDLADALQAGQLAGAALDVVSAEPIRPDNPLLSAPNCVLTPHLAWGTIEARRRLMQITADNVAAFLGGQPRNLVAVPARAAPRG